MRRMRAVATWLIIGCSDGFPREQEPRSTAIGPGLGQGAGWGRMGSLLGGGTGVHSESATT